MREKIIDLIFEIAKEKDAFDVLEKHLEKLSKKEIAENIVECGILPEMFDHDSSEEKLWAKYADIILARSLNYMGIESKVLGARGNSADVYGETNRYTIVGDAKSSRLSNMTQNPKDFKIAALNTWRKKNSYAVLVGSLLKFPGIHSQVYNHAITDNVTLVSYTHLRFLLDNYIKHDLQDIWENGNYLKKNLAGKDHNLANKYWEAIDEVVCSSVGKSIDDLKKYKLLEIKKTKQIGEEGIHFWQKKIEQYQSLSKEEAVKLLIKAEKIEMKIKIIEKSISKRVAL